MRTARLTSFLVAVVAVLVWSWFASGVRTFTRPAEFFTFVPAFAVLLMTVRPRKRSRHSGVRPMTGEGSYRAGSVLWFGVLLAVLGWELFQLFSKPRQHHPTISSLLNTVISTHPSRLLGYLLWLAAGALLLRDVGARRE